MKKMIFLSAALICSCQNEEDVHNSIPFILKTETHEIIRHDSGINWNQVYQPGIYTYEYSTGSMGYKNYSELLRGTKLIFGWSVRHSSVNYDSVEIYFAADILSYPFNADSDFVVKNVNSNGDADVSIRYNGTLKDSLLSIGYSYQRNDTVQIIQGTDTLQYVNHMKIKNIGLTELR